MTITRVVPNITSGRIDESRQFYESLLGFKVAMDMGWIVTLSSPHNPTAQLSLLGEEKPTALRWWQLKHAGDTSIAQI